VLGFIRPGRAGFFLLTVKETKPQLKIIFLKLVVWLGNANLKNLLGLIEVERIK